MSATHRKAALVAITLLFTGSLLISGCGGSSSGSNGGADDAAPTTAPVPSLGIATKQLQFSWDEVSNTDHYRILVNPDGASGFSVVDGAGAITTLSHNVAVSVQQLDWLSAEYMVEACNADETTCLGSANQTLTAADSFAATGYFKASNTGQDDWFGCAVALSSDGSTLVVGAPDESSAATGVGGDQADNSATYSGAVYVFHHDGSSWSQQAYLKSSNTQTGDRFGAAISLSADGSTLAVGASEEDTANGAVYLFHYDGSAWSQQARLKASNPEKGDRFGSALSLSADGSTLAVGARFEDSAATGIGGDQTDNTASLAGAVYLFNHDGSSWSQQAYIKASNAETSDLFGGSLALSADGSTLAVGAEQEGSAATGIDGDQADNTASTSGAVYLFNYDGTAWSQQAYLKASNTDAKDHFGSAVALSADGATLAVGAVGESSAATGVDGDQSDNTASFAGAVYLFGYDGSNWSQQAYIKASNAETSDLFGDSLALSSDGSTLAVGVTSESSVATGIGGDQTDNSAADSGAVYLFTYDGSAWSQQAYLKAVNSESFDYFGYAAALSADGSTLAVGAVGESSAATGVGGDQTDNTVSYAGAVYLY